MRSPVGRTLTFLTLIASVAPAWASRAVPNRPYVISGPDGAFYARCVPAAAGGTDGRTTVYTVREPADERGDQYDWYAPGGVTLGWSPIAGKVAVLAMMRESASRPAQADWRAQEELRFAIGGRILRSYTSGDLIAFGAAEAVSRPGGIRATYRVLGCEQVPGTNEYDFLVELAPGRVVRFDITTGAPRAKADR